jgi:hypothetical protein
VQGFDLVHHWVVTRAWLHDGPPRDFVLDSSAGWTVITPATAEALGLTVTDSDPDLSPRVPGDGEDAPPVRFAHLPLLRVAGLTLRDQTVLVMDLDALAEACTAAGHEVAGVVGYNVLRSTRLILDYRRRLVRLEPGEA